MNQGKFIFTQLTDFLPRRVFDRIVEKYDGNKYVRSFTCLNQMLCMIFGQLTGRDSMRDLGSIDYFLSPNVDLELNVGSDGWGIYRSLGAKLYLTDKNSKSSVLPYVGLLHGSEQGYQFFEVPVGVSYMTKCGFQTSFQLSSLNYYNVDSYGIHAELKLGWRF